MVGLVLFSHHHILTDLEIDLTIATNFLRAIDGGYKAPDEVPYHNAMHGADVCQTVHTIITRGGMKDFLKLSSLEIFALMVAAACHDFKHPGRNTNFLIKCKDRISIAYNDLSPLENMHISETFSVMQHSPNCDLMRSFTVQQYTQVRRIMIDVVLATDMSRHFKNLSEFQVEWLAAASIEEEGGGETVLSHSNSAASVSSVKTKSREDFGSVRGAKRKMLAMKMMIHTADICNTAKSRLISAQWSHMILSEFFMQGDEEKSMKMDISPMCDRANTSIKSCQVGFITFIVRPTIESWVDFMPENDKANALGEEMLTNMNVSEFFWNTLEEKATLDKYTTTTHQLSPSKSPPSSSPPPPPLPPPSLPSQSLPLSPPPQIPSPLPPPPPPPPPREIHVFGGKRERERDTLPLS
jgi:hypothetical protein